MADDESQAPNRGRLSTLLGTVFGNLYLALGSLLFGGLSAVVGWIPPRGQWVFWCAKLWARGVLFFSGVRCKTTFAAPLDRRGRYVYMANHQSLFDIPLLLASLPAQTRFMAKKSLFRIPVFGWGLSAGGYIPVDRHDRSTAKASFALALEGLKEGSSILIFPEEERTLDGEMLPFKRGGFLISLKSGVPIVPVGIRGAFDIRRRGSYAIHPGRTEVNYGRPIDIGDYSVARRAELVRDVVDEVAKLADRVAPPAS